MVPETQRAAGNMVSGAGLLAGGASALFAGRAAELRERFVSRTCERISCRDMRRTQVD